jgi:two-component system chemotaxis response regulator CheB
VHEGGGVVLAQDEASSAVWGMPGRVSEAGIANATLPLWGIAGALKQRVNAGRPARLESAACAGFAAAPRKVAHGLL